ncbi:MAG TPA: hypothetical protein VJS44_14050 [Pyrinomonadaceae bacterium]|nr:hypothetical protein [Pyrinomonadaceae bacterium]
MSKPFRCDECGKPQHRLAMRDKDGAQVCFEDLLKTEDPERMTAEQRAHYEGKVQSC